MKESTGLRSDRNGDETHFEEMPNEPVFTEQLETFPVAVGEGNRREDPFNTFQSSLGRTSLPSFFVTSFGNDVRIQILVFFILFFFPIKG